MGKQATVRSSGARRASDRLIYDWNLGSRAWRRPPGPIELNDETLRDGLQSPSIQHPPIGRKIELLHHMEALGIDGVDIGYAGASPRAFQDVLELAREIDHARLRIKPNCAARTHEADILPIAEAQERTGVPIAAAVFIGSSPIRQFTEGWDLDRLLRTTEHAVTFAAKLGLEVMYVTEDTTRALPAHLERLYRLALECGAARLCVADTVGHATPWGVQRVVRFVRRVIDHSGVPARLDYHGHRDRGLDVINSLAAFAAGADRVHGCALGTGERVGNTPMDLLLVNLYLLGWIDRDLTHLPTYARAAAEATGAPLPFNYPVLGKDAFETSTGVHAAAIAKARQRGDTWLADRVYSGVPASLFGRRQVISIGPMSGQSNVLWWFAEHHLPPDPALAERILEHAKAADRVLTDDEVSALAAGAPTDGSATP